jgi:hypothetical protein
MAAVLATLALLAALFAFDARPAHAANFTVANTNDSGVGSLRQARGSNRVSGESNRYTVLAPLSTLLRLPITSITLVTTGGEPSFARTSSLPMILDPTPLHPSE